MTIRELDQLHEKLDRLHEKVDNILELNGVVRERVAKLESYAGFTKVGITLVLPVIMKVIYDLTRSI